ncbi:HlyD family efflux transporter periplasmic adaptor subunit, partial [Pseudoxanthobacter sp.]|uniref:HlyD family secretion protein n=1 Tax=Pseudoxanthobacter sp. TaxID=1925742 RepID=UPI002FE074C9
MKNIVRVVVVLAVVAVAGAFGVHYWLNRPTLPPGIVSGNGRIEATEIDIAAKYPARIASIEVQEGDLVQPGEVLARLDTRELEAQLAAAKAQVEQARQTKAEAEFVIAQRQTELQLARTEYERNLVLLGKNFVPQQKVDNLKSVRDTAEAGLAAAQSRKLAAEAAIESALANVDQLQQQVADGILTAPRVGRVLFRLAEPGEVVGAGGKVLTVLDLSDIYMTIFLPTAYAGQLSIGEEARIMLEPLPDRAVPGTVSFVSAKAQFTPKQVETAEERSKMMFRVKLRVPQMLVEKYIDYVKTGVPGVGYVRIDPKTVWPAWLESDLTRMATPVPVGANPAEPAKAPAETPVAVPGTATQA